MRFEGKKVNLGKGVSMGTRSDWDLCQANCTVSLEMIMKSEPQHLDDRPLSLDAAVTLQLHWTSPHPNTAAAARLLYLTDSYEIHTQPSSDSTLRSQFTSSRTSTLDIMSIGEKVQTANLPGSTKITGSHQTADWSVHQKKKEAAKVQQLLTVTIIKS